MKEHTILRSYTNDQVLKAGEYFNIRAVADWFLLIPEKPELQKELKEKIDQISEWDKREFYITNQDFSIKSLINRSAANVRWNTFIVLSAWSVFKTQLRATGALKPTQETDR